MKKILTLCALGSASFIFADSYNCPNCPGGGYYQGQGQYSQNSQGYYQNDRNYQNSYQNDRDWDRRQNNQDYYQNDRTYQDRNNNYQNSRQNYQDDQNYYQQNSRQNYQDNNQNQTYHQQNSQGYQNDRNYNSNNTQNSSNQDINQQIREALSSGWFSRGYENVSYDVNNGVVNLRGTVETAKNKTDVEDRIKKINGVRQINNNITVSNNSDVKSNYNYSEDKLKESEKKFPQDSAATLEDRQLNARIRDKLNNGWFSKGYETLILRTSNGVVVISGTVDKSEDVQKIGDQVKEVEGTRSVNNQLSTRNQ